MTQYTYEVINTAISNKVLYRSDGAWIPMENDNSDYQRYLRWLEDPTAEEGGTLS